MSAPTDSTSAATADRLGPDELRAWRGMLKAHAALSSALDADLQREHGLSVPAYEVLMFVGDADGGKLRMADIAERVLLSRSGLTRLVDRLVEHGLVERDTCADDGRGSYAVLTPAGRAKLDAARRTHLQGVRDRFLSRFSPGEQRLLGDLWDRL
jgi:DNA-binding MarR family transcriptional regulator